MFDYQGSLVIDYTLKTITGLRIGGSKEQFEIGGIDNPVLKVEVEVPDYDGQGHTLPEGAPYIPGSSLKGKMRSLLEWSFGRVKDMIEIAYQNGGKPEDIVDKAGKPCSCGQCPICLVFGTGDQKAVENLAKKGLEKLPGPPRLKVFDAFPTYETIERITEAMGENIFTEIKTENQINRLTSRANPRKIERVPAGAEFNGRMVFDFYHANDKDLIKVIFQGMKMLEDNYLGGYGSRGSGRVKFTNITITWRGKEFYLGKEGEKKIAEGVKNLEEALKSLENLKI